MFQTLQYVNAALARVQPTLPPTAKLTANRLTFAAFPILGYSLTSDTMPQTELWELANYTIKPRLNRVNGVSMVVLQGGQVPEFQIEPDPAKLLQAQVTVPEILDAVGEEQHDRFARADREQSRAVADAGERADAQSGRDRQHRGEDHARRRSRADRRHRQRASLGDAGLHHRDGERQARRAAEHLPPAGQQHRRRGARRSIRNWTRSARRCRRA